MTELSDTSSKKVSLSVEIQRKLLYGAMFLTLFFGAFTTATAQRATYPPEEFTERRAKLCEQLDGGAVLMFSETMPRYGARFRQDHDFFYLTGYEGRNAVLLLEVDDCEARLYLPHQGDREKFIDGPNWLYAPEQAEGTGFEVDHLAYLPEHLARRRGRLPGEAGRTLWMRLGERDELDLARSEKGLYLGRREQNPWGGQPTEQAHQIATIRGRYPYAKLRDLTPHLDRLRTIKTPREIEVLRRAGKVSADGISAAIRATRAGGWEYELEAAAKHVFLKHGAEMEAYPAIVGSGPNGLIWHWVKNDRQLENGDLVVMDYGASFAYMTMDITRTWPVTGKFDEVQERAYRAVLEAQKASPAGKPRPSAARSTTAGASKTSPPTAPATSSASPSTTSATAPSPSSPAWSSPSSRSSRSRNGTSTSASRTRC